MHDNSGLINNFTLGQDYFLKRKVLKITNDFFMRFINLFGKLLRTS